MKKKETWIKTRHKVVTAIVRPFANVLNTALYHIKVDKFKEQGERNWLILANHQTDFDQFFIGTAFKKPVYYVAMEDLFSNGFVSKLITWLVAPIPFMKATADIRAVMTCMRIAKEGGSIAIFPEGNRTYSGRTCYIKPSVAALAKKLGLPIAIFRIEGGYGVKPRWAQEGRKGKMKAGVRRVIEPEEYKNMSKDELYELICKELWVDEACDDAEYYCKNAAEGLERVIYVCPECGLSEFETDGDELRCKKCGKKHRYLSNKQLEAIDGETKFRYVANWYDFQEEYIRKLDLMPYFSSPMYSDTADISEVIVYDKKRPMMKNAQITLYADRLEISGEQDKMTLSFDDVKAMACIADHKLNVFYMDRIYQISGDKSFNALKYCNIYYHEKFVKEEHGDGEFQFLGL